METKMNNTLTNNQINSLKDAINDLSDNISTITLQNPDLSNMEVGSTYEVADYAVRMTIAYMLKYGLLDIDNFINLHELSEDEIIELNKELNK